MDMPHAPKFRRAPYFPAYSIYKRPTLGSLEPRTRLTLLVFTRAVWPANEEPHVGDPMGPSTNFVHTYKPRGKDIGTTLRPRCVS